MSNSRGFTWLPILVIGCLVFLAGGAYWYGQQGMTGQQTTEQTESTTTPARVVEQTQAAPTDAEQDATDIGIFTIPNFGISLYAPKILHETSPQTNECVTFSDSGNNAWFTVCRKKASIFSEQGYWGDIVSLFFDQNKNTWMTAVQGTGGEQPGSASVATTTAVAQSRTLTGEPIFLGTGSHSFFDQIVPLDNNTFLVISDNQFGGDQDPTAFVPRVVQSIASGATNQAASQQAFRNVEDAYFKLRR